VGVPEQPQAVALSAVKVRWYDVEGFDNPPLQQFLEQSSLVDPDLLHVRCEADTRLGADPQVVAVSVDVNTGRFTLDEQGRGTHSTTSS
jgi:hypothetical protein